MNEFFSCYIRTLSPIHVGTDEVYEPTGFVVDEKDAVLIPFDPISFLASLSPDEKTRFSQICLKGTIGSILEIYKFLQGKSARGRQVKLTSGFVNHYRKTLSLPSGNDREIRNQLNQFTIGRTAFLNDGRPYLPGSSIKGSLRTAFLNARQKVKKLPPYRPNEAKKLEKDLLDGGSFDTDPFRLVKVSDFLPVGYVKTQIVYAVNHKKEKSDKEARGPYQILEVIEPGSLFQGSILFQHPERKAGIRIGVDTESVLGESEAFCDHQQKVEQGILNHLGMADNVLSRNGGSLIRIGRHSGAECLTIEGHRQIRVKAGRTQFKTMRQATTTWFASPEPRVDDPETPAPFGWCEVCPITAELEDRFFEMDSEWNKIREGQIRSDLAERERLEAERTAAEEEANRKAEEERLKAAEEEERKKRLEQLSPVEKAALRVGEPDVSENEVVDFYQKLSEFDNPKPLALALKEYWRRTGKWKKKDCSTKKQREKVAKIKEIIGEES